MRYITLTLGLLTLLLVGAIGWKIVQRYAEPSILVDGGEVFDAGKVLPNVAITHVFKVENRNSFPVGIAAPVAGCACTTASVSAQTIPSHGAVNVTLRVEPENGVITGSAEIITSHAGKNVATWLFVSGNS